MEPSVQSTDPLRKVSVAVPCRLIFTESQAKINVSLTGADALSMGIKHGTFVDLKDVGPVVMVSGAPGRQVQGTILQSDHVDSKRRVGRVKAHLLKNSTIIYVTLSPKSLFGSYLKKNASGKPLTTVLQFDPNDSSFSLVIPEWAFTNRKADRASGYKRQAATYAKKKVLKTENTSRQKLYPMTKGVEVGDLRSAIGLLNSAIKAQRLTVTVSGGILTGRVTTTFDL